MPSMNDKPKMNKNEKRWDFVDMRDLVLATKSMCHFFWGIWICNDGEDVCKSMCHLQSQWIPGKLRARPVQHPATPALITAQEKSMIMR